MTKISNINQKVDREKYASGWDVVWGRHDSYKQLRIEADVCNVCGAKLNKEGFCSEQERTQAERT